MLASLFIRNPFSLASARWHSIMMNVHVMMVLCSHSCNMTFPPSGPHMYILRFLISFDEASIRYVIIKVREILNCLIIFVLHDEALLTVRLWQLTVETIDFPASSKWASQASRKKAAAGDNKAQRSIVRSSYNWLSANWSEKSLSSSSSAHS